MLNKYRPAGYDPYGDLANAIIIQAVEDYQEALVRLHRASGHKTRMKYLKQVRELEQWFKSPEYKRLTSIDGEYLMNKIKARVFRLNNRWYYDGKK